MVAFELARARQFGGGAKLHMIVWPAAFQCGDEAAYTGLVLNTNQQDFAGGQRPQRPQAEQQQAQQQGHQNSSSALTLRR